MEFGFDAILYSTLGNENSDAGHIKCSRGTQVAQPWSTWIGWTDTAGERQYSATGGEV